MGRSNGGVLGVANTPTTAIASGVWSLFEQSRWKRAGAWPAYVANDPYFNLTTLLLPGNGTNGAQNNTFLDSGTANSGSGFTITRNGNTTQGTFTPYGSNWSNYFDGTGDYLQTSSGITLGTGDFTVEAWVFNTTSGQKPEIWINGGQVGQFVVSTNFNVADAGVILGALSPAGSGWSVALAGSTALTENTWNHIAWVRASGVITVYLNGVAGGTYSNSSNSISLGRIGAFDSSTYDLNGYISNLRVVAGTAVYTANFTPPTAPLTAITNTSLLTCQSNRFIDNSSNAFAITVNGTPSVQAFSPFAPTASYDASVHGGSGYFDGSGDYLTVADNAAFNFGTNNFCIEGWIYPTGLGATRRLYLHQTSSTNQISIYQLNTNYLGVYIATAGTAIVNITSSVLLPANAWTHFAFVRNGSTFTLYQNGVSVGTATSATAAPDPTGSLYIGSSAIPDEQWLGYISSYRVVNGSAVYTAAFTPPTAPLTNITNTSLLLNFTNGGITDATAKNVLETVGNAQISTTQSKFGGSSIYLDGTGDWLQAPNNQLYVLGSSDFTIEAWIYTTTTATQTICAKETSVSNSYLFHINNSSGNKLAINLATNSTTYGLTLTGATTLSINTWYHVAVVRSGSAANNIKLFINGVLDAQGSFSGSVYNDTSLFTIGYRQSTSTLYFNGYIDDFRFTNGYARYTANFTPPTSAFPLQ